MISLAHASVTFSTYFCLFNCFQNSDRAEDFRLIADICTVLGGGEGGPLAPPEFSPLNKGLKQLWYKFAPGFCSKLFILRLCRTKNSIKNMLNVLKYMLNQNYNQ